MSNLLQMPHRCAEAMWSEYELRAQYRREIERERLAVIRGIRNGFICSALIFGVAFAIYWIVRAL